MKVYDDNQKQIQLPLNLKASKTNHYNNSNTNVVCFNSAKPKKEDTSISSALSRVLKSAEKLTW